MCIRDSYQPLAPQRDSLSEHLTDQLRLLNLEENLFILGEEIIGNLDEDGYLKRDLSEILNELDMFEHIKIEAQTGEDLLKRIQKFEPIGIAVSYTHLDVYKRQFVTSEFAQFVCNESRFKIFFSSDMAVELLAE